MTVGFIERVGLEVRDFLIDNLNTKAQALAADAPAKTMPALTAANFFVAPTTRSQYSPFVEVLSTRAKDSETQLNAKCLDVDVTVTMRLSVEASASQADSWTRAQRFSQAIFDVFTDTALRGPSLGGLLGIHFVRVIDSEVRPDFNDESHPAYLAVHFLMVRCDTSKFAAYS